MKFKLLKIFIIAVMFIAICTISNAAISTNDPTVNSGETVTIKVKSNVALTSYRVKANNECGLELISSTGGEGKNTLEITNYSDDGISDLATFVFRVPTVTKDTTYKMTFLGTIMEQYVNGDYIAVPNDDATATITVKAPKTEQPQEQPKDDDKLTTGSTGGTTTEVKSSNNYLKSLKLSTGSINFNKKTTKYTLDVAEDVENITITAAAEHEKASVSGSGKINLVKGTNTAKVVVTAENGSARTYTLTIVRAGAETEEIPEEAPVEEIVGLTSLSLKGIKDNGDVLDLEFTPEFAIDTFYYKCDVPYDINNIDVDSTCDILDAIIEITGNENLHDGENLINIIIKYMTEAGEEKTVTYQIEVNKLANVVQTISEEEIPEPNKIFIVFLIIPVICLIIAIILIVRYKKQDKDPLEETEFGTYGKPLYDENEPEHEVDVGPEQEVVENLEETENISENEIVNIAEEENKKSRKKKKGKHF